MGKSKGKLFVSLIGAFIGGFKPGIFGVKGAFAGAMMGASLGSTIWGAMHPPKAPDMGQYQKFDALMNETTSESMIPIIYGTRKWAGNNLWHKNSSNDTIINKHILIGEGENDSVSDVRANDLSIIGTHVLTIVNTIDQNATVSAFKFYDPFKKKETVVLYLNNTNTVFAAYGTYKELCDSINQFPGWVATTNVPNDSAKLEEFSETNCYNKNKVIYVGGLPGCSYSFYNGSLNQSPPINWSTVGGYKGISYLNTTLKISSSLQGGNPTITYIIRGKKVNVWRNNQWYYEYSNNPAWCVRDFLCSYVYGVAKFVPGIEDMIDEDSFKEVADYCDEFVSYIDADGNIQQEKRYQLNIILSEKKNVIEHLSEMFSNFGGFLTFTNNKIALRIEKSTEASYTFTDDTIIEKSMIWNTTSLDDTPNQYRIGYFDPNNNWTQVKVLVEDTVDQQERQKVIPKEITLTGTTSQTQAKRLGKLYKDLNKLCPLVCQFQTSTFAMHLEPGDVINISYRGLIANMPFRILELSEQNGVWTIKARQYNESIYYDELHQIEVKNYVLINSPLNDNIPSIENLQVSEYGWMNKDGTHISNIDLSWDNIEYEYFRQYIVYYSTDNINFKSITTTLPNCRIPNVETGETYYLKVQLQNTSSRLSDASSEIILITGKDNAPSDISNLSVVQSGEYLNVLVTTVDEPDISYFELRMGATWDNSILIEEFTSKKYTFEAPQEGTLTFWVKTVDNFGNKSLNATKATVNVFGLPQKNIVLDKTEDLSLWSAIGMFRDGTGAWQIKSNEILGDYTTVGDMFNGQMLTLYPTPSLDLPVIDLGSNIIDTSNYYVAPNGNTKVKSIEILGDYTTVGDMFNGQMLTLQQIKYITQTFISLSPMYNQSDNNRIDISYATSIDNVLYGEYISSINKQFFGRYIKINLKPISTDGITNVRIYGMNEIIDVPDIENIIDATDIPASTTHITFKQKFYATPKSVAIFTSDTTGKQATYRISNITNSGLDLDILDNSGSNIAGILQQARIRGY